MKNNTKDIVLYYDGHCHLCNYAVGFVMKHDRKKVIRIATLQSEEGIVVQQHSPVPIDANAGSIILFYKGGYYTRSNAILKILYIIGGLWQLLYAVIIIPRPIRDSIYNLIARNRYRWFGKVDQCEVGTP